MKAQGREVTEAAILAAGRGSRLKSLTSDIPKALVTIGGVPLIDRLISILKQAGIEDLVCVVGYKADMIQQHLETLEPPPQIRFKRCRVVSSMHSFSQLKGEFRRHFLLCNADSVFIPQELFGFMDWIRQEEREIDLALMVTRKVLDEEPLQVVLGEDGRISRIGKRISEATHYCAGAGVFSPDVFREMSGTAGEAIEHLSDYLGFVVRRGYRAFGYEIIEAYDIDRCEDLTLAEAFVRRSRANSKASQSPS